MSHLGEVRPVLTFNTKGRFRAARPFPPGPWTEHSWTQNGLSSFAGSNERETALFLLARSSMGRTSHLVNHATLLPGAL